MFGVCSGLSTHTQQATASAQVLLIFHLGYCNSLWITVLLPDFISASSSCCSQRDLLKHEWMVSLPYLKRASAPPCLKDTVQTTLAWLCVSLSSRLRVLPLLTSNHAACALSEQNHLRPPDRRRLLHTLPLRSESPFPLPEHGVSQKSISFWVISFLTRTRLTT